jgi:hypothetical protein
MRGCHPEREVRGHRSDDRDDTRYVIGGFVQRLCAGTAPAGRRRVLAVDGKTLRGSRHVDDAGTEVAGRHLLAVIDQHSRVVLGQTAVDATVAGKSSEIHQFTALLDTLTGLDLAGTARLGLLGVSDFIAPAVRSRLLIRRGPVLALHRVLMLPGDSSGEASSDQGKHCARKS